MKIINSVLKKYQKIYNEMIRNDNECIPLCAAQTHISSFCKQPLISNFEGKYSFLDNVGNNSFVDGKYVEALNDLLSEQCNKTFGSIYTNADTLTGINCFTVCAMSLLNSNHNVLLTTPEQGGHPSIPIILDTLGVNFDSMPYDYNNFQIDYFKTNLLIKNKKYDYLIFCQSDIIDPPDFSKLNLNHNTGIIYDATQTLGLIAGKAIDNPLDTRNVILIGGTHKTLPAPACGLIMTNNDVYINKLKHNITPNYLRNTQPNHIASLLFSLVELEEVGVEYQRKTIYLANLLGSELEKQGFKLAKLNNNVYTKTHQLFLLMSQEETDNYYENAQLYNISLNKKKKLLFHNNGIRLGVQQIARYNWDIDEIIMLSQLLKYVYLGKEYHAEIMGLRKKLIDKKIPHFEYQFISIE